MVDLKKLFVLVSAGTIGEGKSTTIDTIKSTSTANPSKIYFVEDTNEIVVKGVAYGANPDTIARIAALETALTETGSTGSKIKANAEAISALQTLLGASTLSEGGKSVTARIAALEKLVGDDAEDSDAVISKLNEVYAWFAEVAETETGKALIDSVAANKAAIGKATVGTVGAEGYVAGTGLTKRIEDLEAVNANRDLTTEDAAVEGQYVSSVSQNADGTIEVSRANLPKLSVKEGSANYVSVSNHEVEIKTTTLGAVNLTKGPDGWSAPKEVTTSTGLATAADVAAEIVANEQVVATALNDHEDRITAIETWNMWENFSD